MGVSFHRNIHSRTKKVYSVIPMVNGGLEKSVIMKLNGSYQKIKPFIISRLIRLDEFSFLGTGLFGSGRFALMDNNGNCKKVFSDFDELNKLFSNLNNVQKLMAVQGNFLKKPSSGELAFVTGQNVNSIIYFKITENDVIIRNKVLLSAYKPIVRNNIPAIDENNPAGIVSAACSQHRIFLLYSEKSLKKHGADFTSTNKIVCYDWEGNLREIFSLDKEVIRIGYNKSTNSIIGVTILSEPTLIDYAL